MMPARFDGVGAYPACPNRFFCWSACAVTEIAAIKRLSFLRKTVRIIYLPNKPDRKLGI